MVEEEEQKKDEVVANVVEEEHKKNEDITTHDVKESAPHIVTIEDISDEEPSLENTLSS